MFDQITYPISESVFETARSSVMRRLLSAISEVAPSAHAVLLIGDRGTGKEWIARRIHFLSHRVRSRFVIVDYGAMPAEHVETEIFGCEVATQQGVEIHRGAFEKASGGTVYFDELADLSIPIQVKISEALRTKKIRRVGGQDQVDIDVRVIGAIGRKPDTLLEGGILGYLYDCLTPVVIGVPPLRRRRGDIPPLIQKFISQSNMLYGMKVSGISAAALEACLLHDWPGNIHELREAIEHAVFMCQDHHLIQLEHLPFHVRNLNTDQSVNILFPEEMSIESVERSLIERVVDRARTKREAARLLGISVKTLYNKLIKYSLPTIPSNDRLRKDFAPKKGGSISRGHTDRGRPAKRIIREEGATRPSEAS